MEEQREEMKKQREETQRRMKEQREEMKRQREDAQKDREEQRRQRDEERRQRDEERRQRDEERRQKRQPGFGASDDNKDDFGASTSIHMNMGGFPGGIHSDIHDMNTGFQDDFNNMKADLHGAMADLGNAFGPGSSFPGMPGMPGMKTTTTETTTTTTTGTGTTVPPPAPTTATPTNIPAPTPAPTTAIPTHIPAPAPAPVSAPAPTPAPSSTAPNAPPPPAHSFTELHASTEQRINVLEQRFTYRSEKLPTYLSCIEFLQSKGENVTKMREEASLAEMTYDQIHDGTEVFNRIKKALDKGDYAEVTASLHELDSHERIYNQKDQNFIQLETLMQGFLRYQEIAAHFINPAPSSNPIPSPQFVGTTIPVSSAAPVQTAVPTQIPAQTSSGYIATSHSSATSSQAPTQYAPNGQAPAHLEPRVGQLELNLSSFQQDLSTFKSQQTSLNNYFSQALTQLQAQRQGQYSQQVQFTTSSHQM